MWIRFSLCLVKRQECRNEEKKKQYYQSITPKKLLLVKNRPYVAFCLSNKKAQCPRQRKAESQKSDDLIIIIV